jgi:predicted AAA+ superfamily ATPase
VGGCYDQLVVRILDRLITPVVESALRIAPVVVLEGGRATGKSTVCDLLIQRHGWAPRLDLSDQAVRDTLRLDPNRFLASQPATCVLDEAQLEPELTLWVKRQVDQRRTNGRSS